MVLEEIKTSLIMWFSYALIPCLFVDGVAVLPAPQNLSVQSTNMKHVLTWSPVIVPEEIVHYSVEYQGEYESLYTSHIWIPSSWCSSTQRPECDITEDITATVSYSLRVRATLGSLTSAWSTLKHRFNQNSTILTPPGMEITMDGFHLLIKLEDLGPHFEFFVSYWRREPGAKEHVKVVKPGVLPVYLETVEPGAAYCVKARTFVKAIGRHSAFSRTECVKVQGCMGSGGEIVLCSNPHPNPEVKVHPHLTKGGSLGSCLAHFPPESFRGLRTDCEKLVDQVAAACESGANAGEALPLALALFAFVGFVLILVVALLSVWKMGRLLQYSCCPVVMLPDTLKITNSPQKLISCRKEEVEACVTSGLSSEELLKAWI